MLRKSLCRPTGWLVAGLLLAGGLLLWWQLAPARPRDEVWARVQQTGVLTVATDASYPPFEALDANGDFFGFDIDLARELARRLGVRAEFENIAYDGLPGALVVKRDDVVISAFVPRPEWLKDVSYSRPYFNAGPLAVLSADSTWGPAPGSDRNGEWARGRALAVEYGSTADALVRSWMRLYPDITLHKAPTAGDAMLAVEHGAADAAVVDAVSAYGYLPDHPGLRAAGPPLEDQPYVMAVNVRSAELLTAINEALAAMEADGTLAPLRAKWRLGGEGQTPLP